MHTSFDTEESKAEKLQRKQHYRQQRCYLTSHTTKDENPLEHEKQTLFVNAAVESIEDSAPQLPWLVEIELPKAP